VSKSAPTILFVPGLRGDMPDHWQSILEEELPKATCVPRMREDKLSCAAWVAALDRSIAAIDGPPILVAHSAGVNMVVQWAARIHRPIHGALLVTPPDLARQLPAGYPTRDDLKRGGWLPTPLDPLPFPSIVAASRNDPLARFARVEAMARAWGSRLVDVGRVGHLNPATGFGPWPQARELIRSLEELQTA
jgi:hypothetical protein